MLNTLPTAAGADGSGWPWSLVLDLVQDAFQALLSPPGAFFLVGLLTALTAAYFDRYPAGSMGRQASVAATGCAAVALVLAAGFGLGWVFLGWVLGSVVALVLVIAAVFFLSGKLDRWARQPRKPARSRGRKYLPKSHGQVPGGA